MYMVFSSNSIYDCFISTEKEFQKMCEKAFQEVQILQEAETKMLYRDCIIRTYGIARGPLPDTLCTVFGKIFLPLLYVPHSF